MKWRWIWKYFWRHFLRHTGVFFIRCVDVQLNVILISDFGRLHCGILTSNWRIFEFVRKTFLVGFESQSYWRWNLLRLPKDAQSASFSSNHRHQTLVGCWRDNDVYFVRRADVQSNVISTSDFGWIWRLSRRHYYVLLPSYYNNPMLLGRGMASTRRQIGVFF